VGNERSFFRKISLLHVFQRTGRPGIAKTFNDVQAVVKRVVCGNFAFMHSKMKGEIIMRTVRTVAVGLVLIMGLVFSPAIGLAFSLPYAPLDFDIQDYTSLYRQAGADGYLEVLLVDNTTVTVYDEDHDGYVALPSQAVPQVRDESRAFLKVRNITTTWPDITGPTDDQVYVYGANGEGLIAVERGLYISDIYTNGGVTNIFFLGDVNPQFELYVVDTSEVDWLGDIANGDPQNWSGLYNTVKTAGNSTPYLSGTFTMSTYVGDFEDSSAGLETVQALVGIKLDAELDQGSWINNNELIIGFSSLNPQAWLNLNPNNIIIDDFFGPGKDMAIGNVGLDAQGSFSWGSFSDDWTRAHSTPEPATLLLLGSGLVGMGLVSRRKKKS